MEFDAAAPAPVSAEVLAPADIVTPDEDDDLGAAWDRIAADDDAPSEAEPELEAEPADDEVAETAADPQVDAAPSDLPLALKTAWGALTPEVRDAVAKSHREMSQKLAEQGRLVQGITPIRDVLVEAAKTSPQLMNMTPQQVASEIMQLAKVSNDLSVRPVETIIGVIERYGIGQAVAQALGGQPVTQDAKIVPALQGEIRALQQQLQRVADPEFLRAQVSQVTAQERAFSDLQAFSAKADHWGEVEQYLPDVIPLVQKQLGPDASTKDVLSRAYDLALSIYVPDAKAKAAPAQPAQAASDPKRAEAVLKAKSVNVTSRPNGKQRELSEDDMLSAAYDRIHSK